VKVDELRDLEEDQLGDRLRAARRELYELRFKHAVGQLENSSQISKARHDIARIMTVLSERELGLVIVSRRTSGSLAREEQAEAIGEAPTPRAVDEGFEPDEPMAGASVAAQEPEVADAPEAVEAPKPKRGRKAKTEDKS
jgi:large subunit ribosomal protein L29